MNSDSGREHTVAASQVVMTELVLPNDTNQLGNLLGGKLMHFMDIAMAIAASRHSGLVCVTASVDQIDFFHPVRLGEVIVLRSSVNRVFNTSMEVGVKVFAENLKAGTRTHTNSAYMTFVGLNAEGRPSPTPQVIPETEDEQRRFEEALIRRERRLKIRAEKSQNRS
ncbi:MAG: acyl-CoA thioesterase [Ectothiorhodospiraceae bacterium]|nr:acyl-CoA thioesterase [Ectothiorhodospiraceae bacterium]